MRRRLLILIQGLILPVAIVALWEWLGARGVLPEGILPRPSTVARAWSVWAFGEANSFGLNSYSGGWGATVLYSLRRVAEGFAVAVVVGVPLGVMIGWSKIAARGLDPTIQGLRPIPITAWLPFSIALFGIRDAGAVFLIALGAFYPIVVNATHGARETGRNLVRAARMMGATPMALLTRVVFPGALPAILTGMRIGLGVAWTAVIVAEIVAVKSGLGYVLWDAYDVGRMDIVLADMVSIGLAGFLSDRLMLLLTARLLHWRTFQRA